MSGLRRFFIGTTILVCLLTGWCKTEGSTSEEESEKSTNGRPAGRIAFTLDRNRLILPVRVAGSRELKIILDTGMPFDGLYLFKKELADECQLTAVRDVRVPGAGDGEASHAVQVDSVNLTIEDLTFTNRMVVISQSANTQSFPTDGVLGWTLFGNYVVAIDYDSLIITLYDTLSIAADSTWEVIDIELKNNIPFFQASLAVGDETPTPVTLYLDLASGDALEMLVTPDQKFDLPEGLKVKHLGTGLSGDIFGHVGRVALLRLGPFELREVVTSFAPAAVRSRQVGADGILGNNALRRFNAVFDYPGQRLLLKPNDQFDAPFEDPP